MAKTSMTIVAIAVAVGFQTQAHFTTVFKRFAGSTPHRWRAIRQFPMSGKTEAATASN
jgi:AraC family transcriptional regulator